MGNGVFILESRSANCYQLEAFRDSQCFKLDMTLFFSLFSKVHTSTYFICVVQLHMAG